LQALTRGDADSHGRRRMEQKKAGSATILFPAETRGAPASLTCDSRSSCGTVAGPRRRGL